jgi:hypothetical protein
MTKPAWRHRYDLANPRVTIRLTASLKKILDELREKEDLSYTDLVKRGLEAAGDQEAAYRTGWDDAKKDPVPLGICPNCGKSMNWNLTKEKDRELLAKTIETAGIAHSKCKA